MCQERSLRPRRRSAWGDAGPAGDVSGMAWAGMCGQCEGRVRDEPLFDTGDHEDLEAPALVPGIRVFSPAPGLPMTALLG